MLDPLRRSPGTVLSPALRGVLAALQRVYGSALVVTDLDAKGASLQVRGWTPEVLIRNLMARKTEIFGADVPAGGGCVLGPGSFQILAPLDAGFAAVVSLRYLPAMPDGSDYRSGFWYF